MSDDVSLTTRKKENFVENSLTNKIKYYWMIFLLIWRQKWLFSFLSQFPLLDQRQRKMRNEKQGNEMENEKENFSIFTKQWENIKFA